MTNYFPTFGGERIREALSPLLLSYLWRLVGCLMLFLDLARKISWQYPIFVHKIFLPYLFQDFQLSTA